MGDGQRKYAEPDDGPPWVAGDASGAAVDWWNGKWTEGNREGYGCKCWGQEVGWVGSDRKADSSPVLAAMRLPTARNDNQLWSCLDSNGSPCKYIRATTLLRSMCSMHTACARVSRNRVTRITADGPRQASNSYSRISSGILFTFVRIHDRSTIQQPKTRSLTKNSEAGL